MTRPQIREDVLGEMVAQFAAELSDVAVSIELDEQRLEQGIITANRIKFEEIGASTYAPSMGSQSGSDPDVGDVTIPVQVLIDAQSTLPGAMPRDHKVLATWFADLVYGFFVDEGAARSQVMTEFRATGGFLDRPEGEIGTGARYVLNFELSRSVKRSEKGRTANAEALGVSLKGRVNVAVGNETGTEPICGG